MIHIGRRNKIDAKKNTPKDVKIHIGAGEENRTLTVSLEG